MDSFGASEVGEALVAFSPSRLSHVGWASSPPGGSLCVSSVLSTTSCFSSPDADSAPAKQLLSWLGKIPLPPVVFESATWQLWSESRPPWVAGRWFLVLLSGCLEEKALA